MIVRFTSPGTTRRRAAATPDSVRRGMQSWVCAGLVLGAMSLLTGCGPGSRDKGGVLSSPRDLTPRTVAAGKAVQRSVEKTISVIGALAPVDQATLSVKVPGRLSSFRVDLGSQVHAGDVLAELEKRDYELKLRQSESLLAQARARLGLPLDGDNDHVDTDQASTVKLAQAVLNEAKANRDRVSQLTLQKILSQSELETADATYQVALNRYQEALEDVRNREALLAQRRAEVEIARQQLADTELVAPFDGAVQERRSNRGEFLPAGTPVLTLVRQNPLRLRVEVPERLAANVHHGQTVRIHVEADTKLYSGKIERLSPAINDDTRMLVVEADVPNPGTLRPGLFTRADIVINAVEQAVTVSPSALSVFAGMEKVFVIEQGKAVEKNVETGRRGPDWIEIVHGLKAGETVVMNPGNLLDGQPVVVDLSLAEKPAT